MNKILPFLLLLLVFSCQVAEKETTNPTVEIDTPEALYGQLFEDAQLRTDLFPDSKTFVDCVPLKAPSEIVALYEQLENKEDKDVLLGFLKEHFVIPGYEEKPMLEQAETAGKHIQYLWDVLKREADERRSGTLIPLPNDYIVPGGRFREVYYWDSYFTMLGLKKDGEDALIKNVVDNFSFLIDSVGFIPNGNRTYYNTRSQPPFYALMVALSVEGNKEKSIADYHKYLLKEYSCCPEGIFFQ